VSKGKMGCKHRSRGFNRAGRAIVQSGLQTGAGWDWSAGPNLLCSWQGLGKNIYVALRRYCFPAPVF